MIKAVKHRMKKDEQEGFTLIELMVVVLILGILMAIAIPTFLSITSSAKKNAAEADLTTAVEDEGIYYANSGSGTSTYGGSSVMGSTDGAITWVADTGTTALAVTSGTLVAAAKQVGVDVISSNEVVLDTLGKDGTYYWADINNGKVTYATTTTATGPTVFSATTLP